MAWVLAGKALQQAFLQVQKMARCSFKNSLRNRHHLQDIHAHSGVVVELLHKPTVYDVPLWEKSWMMNLFTGKKSVKHLNNADCKANDQRSHSLYAVDGERRCCNVRGHYTLPDSCRRGLKDLSLLICEGSKMSKNIHHWLNLEKKQKKTILIDFKMTKVSQLLYLPVGMDP